MVVALAPKPPRLDDFEPYSGLIYQLKLNKPDFEAIVTKYTEPTTFDTEEPDTLIPFTNSDNLINIIPYTRILLSLTIPKLLLW